MKLLNFYGTFEDLLVFLLYNLSFHILLKDLWQEHKSSDGTVLGVGLHGKEEQKAAWPHPSPVPS